MSEQHRPVPFAETDFAEQPGFTVLELEDGLTIKGSCPACFGHTSMTFRYGTPQGYKGPFRKVAVPQRTRQITVYCVCGHLHADRPTESPENGCGAYWLVNLG
ncbi:hypothetical protein Aple_044250 [Acrocarpospora pleiomorpha]|uniref:Uncharacterized protein n=1 Tax=Acrocarpospora pleiomorpha TaxID=90975 RepID=A0A5M3XN22_9ACTN|nr:hypothetical protein Aple_044250 [Acrocarpospora pleiomorpha]